MLFSLYSDRPLSFESKATPETLGPGVYETAPPMGTHAPQKAPFGTRTSRGDVMRVKTESPPPGYYNPQLTTTAIPITSSFKSESKRSVYQTSSNPGPTDYDPTGKIKIKPLNRRKKLPTCKLQSGYVGQDVAGFNDVNGELVPIKIERRHSEDLGPGTYDPQPSASLAYMKCLDRGAERQVFPKPEPVPGPGEYSVEKTSSKIPMKIGGINKPPEKPRDDPDEYLAPAVWTQGAEESSAVFKARDERIAFVPNTLSPGPGTYHGLPAVRRSAGDGFGFGAKAERKTFVPLNSNPGPGAYNVKEQPWIKDQHSTTAKAIDREPPERAPGPGHYRLVKSWGGEGITSVFTSKAGRTDYRGNGVPGPGRYVPRIIDRDHVVPMLIRESRFEKVGDWISSAINDVPGPGAYEQVIPISKGRSISSLCVVPNRGEGPGPGTYDVVHGSMLKKSANARMRIVG